MHNKLQVAANIALLLGLIMVVFQIEQANDISSAQFLDSAVESSNSRQIALLGENPNQSMVRVLYRPAEATIDDYFIADRVYEVILSQMFRSSELTKANFNLASTETLINASWDVFACPYGRAYLEYWIDRIPEEEYDQLRSASKLLLKRANQANALEDMQARMQRTQEILDSLQAK